MDMTPAQAAAKVVEMTQQQNSSPRGPAGSAGKLTEEAKDALRAETRRRAQETNQR